MKIAVQDSRPEKLRKFEEIITSHYNQKNETVEIELFENALDLVDSFNRGGTGLSFWI